MPESKEINILDFVSLLYNYTQCEDFEDPEESVTQFLGTLAGHRVRVSEHQLEILLASSNMLAEKGKFWHPNLSFDRLLGKLRVRFDKKHNLLLENK